MTWLLLAVLLSAPQTSKPVPPTQTNQQTIPSNSKPTSASAPNKEQNPPLRISEFPSVSIKRDWVAIVLTGILAVVGIVGVCAAIKTLKTIRLQARIMARQTAATREAAEAAKENAEAAKDSVAAILKSVQAQINAERAWVIVELVPTARQYSDRTWYRQIGDRQVAMSSPEILRGDHLRHVLRFTNMGRTPAHILSFQIGYSCLPEGVTDLPEKTQGDVLERQAFDKLLAASESIELTQPVVDVQIYFKDDLKRIYEFKKTAVFLGWVDYQHVFDDSEIVRETFVYTFSPTNLRLNKVARPRNRGTKRS